MHQLAHDCIVMVDVGNDGPTQIMVATGAMQQGMGLDGVKDLTEVTS
jgi:hypothetical protein